MRHIAFIAAAFICLLCPAKVQAQFQPDLPEVAFVDYQSENREWFVRCAQFQLFIEYESVPETGMPLIKNPEKFCAKIDSCLNLADSLEANILVFPELSMALTQRERNKFIRKMESYSKEKDAIIIAGTYYNKERYCKNVVILPDGVRESYKIRPSIFEVATDMGKGMNPADTMFVFRTKYGNFLPLVCVDLISDDANYLARSLSNRGLIDMVFNIQYNPKSQEFMREASIMTVRHPLFVSLTNVCLFQKGNTYDSDEFGNTSIFGSINPFIKDQILKNIPDFYKTPDLKQIQPAYKDMLAVIPPEKEGALIYDLNLRVIRAPYETNAPDQGYPTIKNIRIIEL